ncbi:MAG: OsmC family protein [Pseudomonadota bacterium]
MHVNLTWAGAVQFHGTTATGHSLTIDGPAEGGGQNGGPRPMELMLMGAAGCTAYDVVTILGKSRQEVTRCDIEASATRADGVPAVFETIHFRFRLRGHNLDASKVERAIRLSAEKYCSGSITLKRAGVTVTHDFEIEADTP